MFTLTLSLPTSGFANLLDIASSSIQTLPNAHPHTAVHCLCGALPILEIASFRSHLYLDVWGTTCANNSGVWKHLDLTPWKRLETPRKQLSNTLTWLIEDKNTLAWLLKFYLSATSPPSLSWGWKHLDLTPFNALKTHWKHLDLTP